MVEKTNYSNKSNYGGARSLDKIKYIVVHYTGNDGDSDEGNGNYFHNNVVKASAHRFVDDDSCTISVPDNYIAYAVGGHYANKAGGGSFYNICTNSNSLSIELCDTQKNGTYNFTEATLANAAEVIKGWMAKYNIDVNHVIRHFDVNNKICPAPFVNDTNAWNAFKARLTGTVAAPSPSPTPVVTPTISGDADVLELQKALNADGYTDASGHRLSEDGRWGNNTLAAASKVAVKAKKVGPIYKVCSTGEVVKFVQRRIGTAADGKFGSGSRKALIVFQSQHSLSADGVAGPATLKAMCF